jgi:hypothetical protein
MNSVPSPSLLPANGSRRLAASASALLALAVAFTGCQDKPRAALPRVNMQDRISQQLNPALHDTIGEYAAFVDAAPITVSGWGMVYVHGTGSSDMPPRLKEQFMSDLVRVGMGSYSAGMQQYDPERFLNSNQVAAVEIHGVIPPLAKRGDSFDLSVKALPGTGTTSLEDGLLLMSELRIVSTPGMETEVLAKGEGPIFISAPVEAAAGASDAQSGAVPRALRDGRILGGGKVTKDRLARLQLYSPSWQKTRLIEQAINAHLPAREKVATAETDSIVTLHVPAEYSLDPMTFVDAVRHLYLRANEYGFAEQQAGKLLAALQQPGTPHRDFSVALQGLGRSILPDFIQTQYAAADPDLRFWCARAGAGLDDVGAKIVLQEMIKDRSCPLRAQAVDALVDACRGRDTARASNTLAELLKSSNTEERVWAYRGLVGIHSRLVTTYQLGNKSFYMDLIPIDCPPMIYVTQASSPRIALIGRPMILPPSTVYISPDTRFSVSVNDATADAGSSRVLTAASLGASQEAPSADTAAPAQPAGKETVTLYWRPPAGGPAVNLKTVPDLAWVIARSTMIPDPRKVDYDPRDPFIGASYQRIAEMLATLCKERILDSQFVLQPAPTPILTTAEIVANGRSEVSTKPPATAPAQQPAEAPPATQPAP